MPSMPKSAFGVGILRPRRFPAVRRGGKRQPVPKVTEWKIVRGDTVMILAGKDKGKIGDVSDVIRSKNHIYVKGMNTHQRYFRSYDDFPGGYFPSEAPLQLNEVALIDPSNKEPTDVVYRYTEKGDKVRVSTNSGHIVPKPSWERRDWKVRSAVKDGNGDTTANAASRRTYIPSLLHFHEEIMQTLNIKSTVPKTELVRRDLMMKDIENACQWSVEKKDLETSHMGLYDRAVLFMIVFQEKITRPFRR